MALLESIDHLVEERSLKESIDEENFQESSLLLINIIIDFKAGKISPHSYTPLPVLFGRAYPAKM